MGKKKIVFFIRGRMDELEIGKSYGHAATVNGGNTSGGKICQQPRREKQIMELFMEVPDLPAAL